MIPSIDEILDEMAFAVQFSSLGNAAPNIMASVRTKTLDDYPSIEYQPRIQQPPLFMQQQQPQQVTFQLSNVSPLGSGQALDRLWIVSRDKSNVIQFQDDRFIFNWRRVDDTFPGDSDVNAEFSRVLKVLGESVSAESLSLNFIGADVSFFLWVPEGEIAPGDWLVPSSAAAIHLGGREVNSLNQQWRFDYKLSKAEVEQGLISATANGNSMKLSRVTGKVSPGTVLALTYSRPLDPGTSGPEVEDCVKEASSVLREVASQLIKVPS